MITERVPQPEDYLQKFQEKAEVRGLSERMIIWLNLAWCSLSAAEWFDFAHHPELVEGLAHLFDTQSFYEIFISNSR